MSPWLIVLYLTLSQRPSQNEQYLWPFAACDMPVHVIEMVINGNFSGSKRVCTPNAPQKILKHTVLEIQWQRKKLRKCMQKLAQMGWRTAMAETNTPRQPLRTENVPRTLGCRARIFKIPNGGCAETPRGLRAKRLKTRRERADGARALDASEHFSDAGHSPDSVSGG